MRNILTLTVAVCVFAVCSGQQEAPKASSDGATSQPAPTSKPTTQEKGMTSSAPAGNPVVVVETSMGTFKAELFADKAPITVENFVKYVDSGFFDGLIFHRVIPDFMIQGGGFDPKMNQKETKAAIKNEARADVKNDRGTLAMARTSQVDSATAQFFVNLKDNDFLNHKDNTARGFGYCVFGKVTDGMDVVDKIAKVRTATSGMNENVPVETVKIISIKKQ